MKVDELMIGDWVKIKTYGVSDKYEITEVYIYIKVAQIGSGLITVEYNNDIKEPYRICETTEIVPIPLTPEILEKNGFRKSVSPPGIHAECYEINNKDEKYCLTIANYNKYKRLLLDIDAEDSECFNIKCDYVHQLQHALKLCGIEKEIEL